MTVAAPQARVWDLLLDPKIMAGCVPGTQSVDVVSDVEYVADIRVKISFIAARFKIKTTIVEARRPDYLRIEGTGEDSSVASSMTQSSELFLTDLGDGRTEIRIKARTAVLGRLGSFGLSVMKTKADRMWDEFGANFSAVAVRGAEAADASAIGADPGGPIDAPAPHATTGALTRADVAGPRAFDQASAAPMPAQEQSPPKARWWQRANGAATADGAAASHRRLATDIYVELHRPNGVIKVLWPASAAADAVRWLKDVQ